MAWLDFAPSDAGLEEFGVRHGIHTLHLEDCRYDEQQAKIEHGDGYLFIVLKLVLLTSDELSAADLDVFLGADLPGHCAQIAGSAPHSIHCKRKRRRIAER